VTRKVKNKYIGHKIITLKALKLMKMKSFVEIPKKIINYGIALDQNQKKNIMKLFKRMGKEIYIVQTLVHNLLLNNHLD